MKKMSFAAAPKSAPGFHVGKAIAAVAGLAMTQAALGVSTVYTWNGPAGGGYNTAANWNPVGIPDTLGEAFLLNGGTATMAATSTVDWFDLQNGTLTIPNAVSLQVDTQIAAGLNETGIGGGGTINLNSSGSTTSIRLTSGVAGDKFIWANTQPGVTSTINMGSGTNNQITGSVTGMLLVNQALIRGAGQVGVNVLNIENASGVLGSPAIIESNQVGSSLTIDPSGNGLMNDGILRSSGGVLRLINGTFDQTANGVIELVGSDVNARVELSAAVISGGTLRQTAFGVGNFVDILGGSELDSVQFNGVRARVTNAQTNYLTGVNVLDASTVITLNSTGSVTALQPTTGEVSTTLSGAGRIQMSDATNNLIRASTTGQGLVNNLLGGIIGAGQIGNNTLVVTNNTFIEASGTAGLLIDPPTVGGLVNNGSLRAAGGSTLTLTSGTVSNATGNISAPAAGSVVVANAATIIGGSISTANGGEARLQGGSTLQDVTIAGGSTARIPNNTTLDLIGTLVNNGTLSIDSVANNTVISTFGGDVVINGTGQIVTTNAANNLLSAAVTGQRMTLNNNGGFVGAGQIGANVLVVTNNTLIAAEGSSGLKIDPPAVNGFTNNGTVRSNAGSLLTILAGPFDNTNGVIQVLSGGAGTFNSAAITGGSIQGPGVVSCTGTSSLSTLTIAGNATVDLTNGAQVNLTGPIVLNGVVSLSTSGSTTDLRTTAIDVVVNGSGQILMNNGTTNYIRAAVTGQRLTLNNAGGVRGSGQIGADNLAVTNNTTIAASGTAGLKIDPVAVGGFDNNALILVETGSSLAILGGPFENTDAFIRLQPGSTASLQSVAITGGTLQGATGSEFTVTTSPSLAGVTLDAAAKVRINNAQALDIIGGMVNNGEIIVDGAGNVTNFRVSGNQTLSGTGTITLASASSRMSAAVSNQRLTIVGNTVHGTGLIGVDTLGVTNRGSVLVDNVGGITIDPPAGAAFLNEIGGLVHLTAGNISVSAGGFSNNGGTLIIDAGRKFDRTSTDIYTQTDGLTLVNGELEVDGNNFQLQGGVLAGSGNTANNGWVDSNVTNTNGLISPGSSASSGVGTLTIEGAFTQSGNGETLIEIAGPVAGQFDKLVVNGAAATGGVLRVRLLDGYEMAIGDVFDVVTATTRTGDFDSIVIENLPFALQFNVEMLGDRVRLIAAERCLGDYDRDGGITGGDIAAFFTDFEQGSADADLDQDGGITGGDIAEFFTRFENGC